MLYYNNINDSILFYINFYYMNMTIIITDYYYLYIYLFIITIIYLHLFKTTKS